MSLHLILFCPTANMPIIVNRVSVRRRLLTWVQSSLLALFINSINTLLPLPQQQNDNEPFIYHASFKNCNTSGIFFWLLIYSHTIAIFCKKTRYLWSTECSDSLWLVTFNSFLCSMVYPQFALVCLVQYPTQTIWKDENVVRTCHMTWLLSMYWLCSDTHNSWDRVPNSNSA